jgi:maleate cis-trans isomerase
LIYPIKLFAHTFQGENGMDTNESKAPVAGLMSPPCWLDPSPEEFRSICDSDVIVQQTMMPLYRYVFGRLDSIAGTLPEMLQCARMLGDAGSNAIANTGTPFGWAGLDTETAARERCKMLADAAGVPAIMAGTAIIDGLRALNVEKVAIATPYYDAEWREAWSTIVKSSGFEILKIQSLDQQELVPSGGNIMDHGWAMTPEIIVASSVKIVQDSPGAQAVVITGAGARTLSLTAEIEAKTGVPVLASDTALFWALAKELDVKLKKGILGALTSV